jgi:hypothetical protein
MEDQPVKGLRGMVHSPGFSTEQGFVGYVVFLLPTCPLARSCKRAVWVAGRSIQGGSDAEKRNWSSKIGGFPCLRFSYQ